MTTLMRGFRDAFGNLTGYLRLLARVALERALRQIHFRRFLISHERDAVKLGGRFSSLGWAGVVGDNTARTNQTDENNEKFHGMIVTMSIRDTAPALFCATPRYKPPDSGDAFVIVSVSFGETITPSFDQ